AADSLMQATGSGELANLATVVQSADREPPQQARDVFEEARGRLAAATRRWQELQANDLPALNGRLTRQRVPPVTAAVTRPQAIEIPWRPQPLSTGCPRPLPPPRYAAACSRSSPASCPPWAMAASSGPASAAREPCRTTRKWAIRTAVSPCSSPTGSAPSG